MADLHGQGAVWTIEPRDPLLVRDGRPFAATPGARAESLEFPFPSTIAGAVRTRMLLADPSAAARVAQGVRFDPSERARVLAVGVQGPLLVEVDQGGLRYMAAAPADCVMLGSAAHSLSIRHLEPLAQRTGVGPALPKDMRPVAMVQHDKAKPYSAAPRYWRWTQLEQWLLEARDADDVKVEDLGHAGPEREDRMHLQIRPQTRSAEEGRLFQTRGLEFQRSMGGAEALSSVQRLGLAVQTDAAIASGIGVMGGERRIVRWRKWADCGFPSCPGDLRKRVVQEKGCRIVLLTPAFFVGGWFPQHVLTALGSGVKVTLRGAAVARAQTVSGWDLDQGAAKPSRRLAPAGSVYFLELDGVEEQLGAFVDALWMACISDEQQAQRDGFGLAVVGAWNPVRFRGGRNG